MANLYEKYLGVGKNVITAKEWQTLIEGYKTLTGEVYDV